MAKSILGAFEGVKTKKKNKDEIKYIFYKDIKKAAKNRDTGNIDDLAEDIAEDGLEQNLVVRPVDDEDYQYELIAGHRRYAAICQNISKGDNTYEYIPCIVKEYDDLDALKRLHLNNINSKGYTPGEMYQAIEDLRYIYQEKKKQGIKEPGRIQSLIANDTGLKKSQVGNYEKVLNHAVDPVKEKLKNDEISLTEALEIAEMENEDQMCFVEENDEINLTTIAEYKERQKNNQENNEEDDDQEDDEGYDGQDYEDDELDYEDLDDYEPYHDDEDESTATVDDLIMDIDEALENLYNKLSDAEWKEEKQLLSKMFDLMEKFKSNIY